MAEVEPETSLAVVKFDYLVVKVGEPAVISAFNPNGKPRPIDVPPNLLFEGAIAFVFTQLGSEGWELITVTPGKNEPLGFYIFKLAK